MMTKARDNTQTQTWLNPLQKSDSKKH